MIEVATNLNHVHTLDERWLRARVRGWCDLESGGDNFWLGTYTKSGEWIFCSSSRDTWHPNERRVDYARNVVHHLNRHCNNGGAWLGGWFYAGRRFYLLWKDVDGDLQIPIECDKPWIVLRTYDLAHWEKIAHTAIATWTNWHKNMQYRSGQTKRVAQGESIH